MTDDIYEMARISCEEIYETSEALMLEQDRRDAQLDWQASNLKGWNDPDAPKYDWDIAGMPTIKS